MWTSLKILDNCTRIRKSKGKRFRKNLLAISFMFHRFTRIHQGNIHIISLQRFHLHYLTTLLDFTKIDVISIRRCSLERAERVHFREDLVDVFLVQRHKTLLLPAEVVDVPWADVVIFKRLLPFSKYKFTLMINRTKY